MEILSFTTQWANGDKSVRVGSPLTADYLLDFERATEGMEQPSSLPGWFDMDSPWFQEATKTYKELVSDPTKIEEAVEKGWLIKRANAYWFAPIPRIGLNYRDHAAESNMPIPERPVVFSKFATSVIGPGEQVILPTSSTQVDYEAELAVVIGRRAKNVSASRAFDYVLGYTCFNDVQYTRAKGFDTFAPMGPTIVTSDAVPDPHKLSIKLILNGKTMQDSNTDQLIFGVPELVEFLSQTITLEPGDVIATGTPPGVGFARKPPVFLQPGDEMQVVIEKVGFLGNSVIEAREGVVTQAQSF